MLVHFCCSPTTGRLTRRRITRSQAGSAVATMWMGHRFGICGKPYWAQGDGPGHTCLGRQGYRRMTRGHSRICRSPRCARQLASLGSRYARDVCCLQRLRSGAPSRVALSHCLGARPPNRSGILFIYESSQEQIAASINRSKSVSHFTMRIPLRL